MAPFHSDVPYGTLDLLVLHTLRRSGPLHGYGLARRIEEAAAGAVTLNQGTIHPALVRLEDKGWIRSRWGMSEHNRRARFYALTPAGRRQLTGEVTRWRRTVAMIERVLRDGRR
jgi:PadR family transcriptional regulator, regulatory protein PadR